ncbi:hypothetical protein QBC34DRAFT_139176 [Podospora aff. communis PSN243]|uniref:DUF7905 domain-containing protein n=1 Tax=Podospora aff. communis PSN243 TaxID=3040156 RepID=A0AAV9H4K6_9PEZI|nr:hypothetical protein QBC34DRAFT_139176 [Podospora aff. communis PSN243]
MSAPQMDVKLHVVLPLRDHGYNRLDDYNDIDDIDHSFREIERKLIVKIDPSEDGNSLTIQAFNKAKAKGAVIQIRHLLKKEKNETSTLWRTQVLVAFAGTDVESSQAIFSLQEDSELTLHPVAPNHPLWPGSGDTPLRDTSFKNAFRDAADSACFNLRRVPNKMRMRVHFGTLILHEQNKGQSDYTKAELEKLLSIAGARGTAKLHRRVMIDSVHDHVRDNLAQSETKILPLRAGTAADIAPTYSVILRTKEFHVQSVIETIKKGGKVQANGKAPSEFCFSPFRASHRGKHERTMDILASCPQRSNDWSLEVESFINENELAKAIPFTQHTLQGAAKFFKEGLKYGYPAFRLTHKFMMDYEVTHLIGCVAWTYHLDTKYTVELTCYYKWDQDMTKEPIQGWTVSLYSSDWDDAMQEKTLVDGPRNWKDFADTFLKAEGGGGNASKTTPVGRYAEFFSKIEGVQKLLEEAKEVEKVRLERKKNQSTTEWLGLNW